MDREQEILEEITHSKAHIGGGGLYENLEVSPEKLATYLARMEGSKEEKISDFSKGVTICGAVVSEDGRGNTERCGNTPPCDTHPPPSEEKVDMYGSREWYIKNRPVSEEKKCGEYLGGIQVHGIWCENPVPCNLHSPTPPDAQEEHKCSEILCCNCVHRSIGERTRTTTLEEVERVVEGMRVDNYGDRFGFRGANISFENVGELAAHNMLVDRLLTRLKEMRKNDVG